MNKKATKKKLTPEETEALFQAERTKKREAYDLAALIAADLYPDFKVLPDAARVDAIERVFFYAVDLDDKGVADEEETGELAGDLREAFDRVWTFASETFGASFIGLNGLDYHHLVHKVFDLTMLDDEGELDIDGADEREGTLAAALKDEHIRKFALEVYGSDSPIALLSAVEVDSTWMENAK